jgi:hypothetical protein
MAPISFLGTTLLFVLIGGSLYWSSQRQSALLYIFDPWLCWRITKGFAEKHSLDNVPGSPSPSIITGDIPRCLRTSITYLNIWAGNFGQLFDPQGWEFHKDIVDKYGGVVKVQALSRLPCLVLTSGPHSDLKPAG